MCFVSHFLGHDLKYTILIGSIEYEHVQLYDMRIIIFRFVLLAFKDAIMNFVS